MKKTIITILLAFITLAGYSQCEICFSLLRTPAGVIIKKQSQPWTFQTSAAETQLVINTLNISAGGSVTIKWADGTQNTYTGNNSSITKNYAVAGQYTVKMYFSDFTKVTDFQLFNRDIIDDISNVYFDEFTNTTRISLSSNSLSGTINITKRTNTLGNLSLHTNNLSGSIPSEIGGFTNLTVLALYLNSFTYLEDISGAKNITLAWFYNNDITGFDSIFIPNNATQWRFDGNLMPSSEVNEVLEDADASITVPTANLTLNVGGTGNGNLPDGAANTFLTSLSAKYTNAVPSRILTVIYNTP